MSKATSILFTLKQGKLKHMMSSRRHVAYQKNNINAGINIARCIDDLNKRKNQGAAAE